MMITDSMNILIVDDNKNNLFTLRNLILEYIEATILEADSGIMALSILAKHTIDLIIMDVQMPEMDGFETAQMIRQRKKTQHIPIVFLTAAYKAKEFEQQGYSLGAADYLTKPIDAPQLISRIKIYLRFIQQERQYNRLLEQKVQERTAALLETNRQLEHEIKEREKIEKALQEAKNSAEEANHSKSQFLANMSHELRTPLNAIIGYSEMLRDEAEDGEHYQYLADLKKIQSAGQHLLSLINDILDLSKIEAGKMGVFSETFELDALIDEVVNTSQPLIEKKHNQFFIERPSNLGKLHADRLKLSQVLLNLLSNAAKFTDCGKITLKIEQKIKEEQDWICFHVSDNGIGMTIEQQKKLFKPFTQADSSTTRRYGGTGLGLTISKQFSEMMQGSINVQSEFGHGSTFSVSIPVFAKTLTPVEIKTQVLPAVEETVHSETRILAERVVLVIDDDLAVGEKFRQDLTDLGYAVAIATTAEDGLKMARKLSPDVILLDVTMSNANGWNLLARLKNDNTLKEIPIIMLQVDAEAELGVALSAVEQLIKPIHLKDLQRLLEKYHLPSMFPKYVLVVDDDEVMQESLTLLLEKEGWHALRANNGREALTLLEATENPPNIIITDLNMPVMDGFTLVENLQQHARWRNIPTIVLTAMQLTQAQHVRLNKVVQTIFTKEAYEHQTLVQHLHQLISAKPLTEKEVTNRQQAAFMQLL